MNDAMKKTAHEALDKMMAELDKSGLPVDGMVDVSIKAIEIHSDESEVTEHEVLAEIIEISDGSEASIEEVRFTSKHFNADGELDDIKTQDIAIE